MPDQPITPEAIAALQAALEADRRAVWRAACMACADELMQYCDAFESQKHVNLVAAALVQLAEEMPDA